MFHLVTVLALASAASPVQKVIQLLDDLSGKVEKDLAKEETLMEEYTTWCDKEANEKEDAITSYTRTIKDLSATIEDRTAMIGTLTSTIEELSGKISASEGDLKTAVSIRATEHEDFAAGEDELVSTVDTLGRAASVLTKNMGLLQGAAALDVNKLTAGLMQIVDASWVTSHQKSVVTAMLQAQTQTSTDDEDFDAQPQATAAAYESKSNGIVDTVNEMRSKAEESLSSMRKDEVEAQHSFDMLRQGLEDSLKVMKQQKDDSTLSRSQTEEELHAADTGLAEEKTGLSGDQRYLKELHQSCQVKADEWAVRQADAAAETKAILKAKDILSEGVTVSLLQVKAVTSADSEERSRVTTLLQGLARNFQSSELMQLANRAASDPFGKIRGLIEGMITRLVEEAEKEATQQAFCEEETGKSSKKQADLTAQMDRTAARIEKAEATIALLREHISDVGAELADMAAGQQEATKVRAAEHADYKKVSQDFTQSAAAVASAILALEEYYKGDASFIQLSSSGLSPEFASAKSDVASTIVSVLEVAEADFNQLVAEADASESSSKAAYDRLVQDNAVASASKNADVKGKEAEIKQTEVALGNFKEDKASTGDELDAVLTYLDKLKPQCESKAMSYAEKKQRREQEIGGLKEALAILGGEAGLLQTAPALRGARRA